ncbi:MAG: winged helix-turn-helix domain-containing protein, partial [Nanoarchaeota archaeon]
MTNNQGVSKGEDNEILGGLFGSETRAKILKILILNSEKAYRLSELSKQTGMDISGVHREISNLVALDIVNTDKQTKNPEYAINTNHPLFSGLVELFKKADFLLEKYFLFEETPVGYPAVG